MSSSSLQHIPKSVNGEAVNQKVHPVHQMDDSAFTVNNQATSRRIVQSNSTVPSVEQEDTYQQNALLNNKATVLVIMKLMIALQDNNTRLPLLATMLEVQVFTKTQINSQTLHFNIVHTHSNTLIKVNLPLAEPHQHSW